MKGTSAPSTPAAKMNDTITVEAPYIPIGCAAYSEFELAILHKQRLHLTWSERNVLYDRVVIPDDLRTANHEEFLICRSQIGETFTIRLDRIYRVGPS